MDASTELDTSPYISNIECVPPSPSSLHPDIDIDHTSPYDNSFSFSSSHHPSPSHHSTANNNAHGSPSYNGSYQNSPFSAHSELSYTEHDLGLGLGFGASSDFSSFLDDPNDPLGSGSGTGYDPTDFDGPSHGGLLMFNDSDNDMYSPTFNPLSTGSSMGSGGGVEHRAPYDYSSPSSNASNGEGGGSRSRASSVGSNHHRHQQQGSSPHMQQQQLSPPPHQQQPQQTSNNFSPSPRLDVAHSFENMSFHSPHVFSEPLPDPTQPSHHPLNLNHAQMHHHSQSLSSHPHNQQGGQGHNGRQHSLSLSHRSQNSQDMPMKPPSPPRLMMPDQEPPTINAPDGMGGGGPQLHIVPATPISGGGAGREPVPFQTRLETLHQSEYFLLSSSIFYYISSIFIFYSTFFLISLNDHGRSSLLFLLWALMRATVAHLFVAPTQSSFPILPASSTFDLRGKYLR
ncbi:hypothetical protein BDQ12DRAFT_724885 [Crucibulum laeve]|uniref:Uncharacterized protein n=1 Tax=Crucibulum laeve TaxID=68775 RepID=A0A5C3LUN9_9AGAR|nr:hypothetical protein BDQ12DRAFT_724885 [Crucibulum laeve]